MKRSATYCISIFVVSALISSCADKLVSGSAAKSTADKSRHIKVMTYNIHHANPPSKGKTGEIDLDAIVRVIRNENPDLVALQEVDVNTKRSGSINQAEAIAAKLDMEVYFGKTINYDGGDYGVAVLSRYPLTEATVIPLPEDAKPEAEDRVLATVKVALPGGKVIRFGSTHLDVSSVANRELQVKTINDIASRETVPFIVAGDFNDTPGSEAIAELDKTFIRTCVSDCQPTIPVDSPTKAIDFIAFSKESPFKVVSQKVIPEKYASDHLPVVATLSY